MYKLILIICVLFWTSCKKKERDVLNTLDYTSPNSITFYLADTAQAKVENATIYMTKVANTFNNYVFSKETYIPTMLTYDISSFSNVEIDSLVYLAGVNRGYSSEIPLCYTALHGYEKSQLPFLNNKANVVMKMNEINDCSFEHTIRFNGYVVYITATHRTNKKLRLRQKVYFTPIYQN